MKNNVIVLSEAAKRLRGKSTDKVYLTEEDMQRGTSPLSAKVTNYSFVPEDWDRESCDEQCIPSLEDASFSFAYGEGPDPGKDSVEDEIEIPMGLLNGSEIDDTGDRDE